MIFSENENNTNDELTINVIYDIMDELSIPVINLEKSYNKVSSLFTELNLLVHSLKNIQDVYDKVICSDNEIFDVAANLYVLTNIIEENKDFFENHIKNSITEISKCTNADQIISLSTRLNNLKNIENCYIQKLNDLTTKINKIKNELEIFNKNTDFLNNYLNAHKNQ